jgi:GT2 family glycosyltransferase
MPLSIVIPTYNTAAMTLACCRAALAALPDGGEVIVVDDASTDGTFELLAAEVPEVRVVRLEQNRRFAGAANAGVAAARAPIVLLLNSDALLDRGAPAALLAAFAADSRLGVAGAQLLNADGTPQWSGGPIPTLAWLAVMVSGVAVIASGAKQSRDRFAPLAMTRVRAMTRRTPAWVSGAAMAFRRSTWDEVGPLDERYRFYAQDLDFCAKARAKGWGVRLVRDARVVHDGGVTVRQWREVAELPHDPALLWLDLLTWGRHYHGRVWTAAAWMVMSVAAMLRVGARRVRELFLRGEERRRAGSATAVYTAALCQLLVEREEVAGQGVAGVAGLDEPPAGVADRTRP